MKKHCIVIGAGPGGLYAGHLLRKAGVSYEILEASDRVAGRVRTLELHGDRLDVGAQVYHSSYRRTKALLKELGLRNQIVPVRGDTHYRMQSGAAWVQGRSPWFSGLGLQGNLAMLRYIFAQVFFKPRPELHLIDRVLPGDQLTAGEFFRSQSSNLFTDYLVPLLCAAMNVSTPEETSLQHLQHIFRITAFTDYFGFREGNEQLWQKLAGGQPISFGKRVRELVLEEGVIRGVRMQGDDTPRSASHVILAMPPDSIEALLPESMTVRRDFFAAIPKTPQLLPVVRLDRRLSENMVNYMGDPRENRHYLIATDCLVKAPHLMQSDESVLTVWDYFPKNKALYRMTEDQVTSVLIADLAFIVPGFRAEWVRDITFVRHSYSHPPYGKGSYARIADFLAREDGSDGVHFASDLFGGSYIECALAYAERAVRQVCLGN